MSYEDKSQYGAVSSKTTKTKQRRHKVKICKECGKSETTQWTRHWTRNHGIDQEGKNRPPLREIQIDDPSDVPLRPYVKDWRQKAEKAIREQQAEEDEGLEYDEKDHANKSEYNHQALGGIEYIQEEEILLPSHTHTEEPESLKTLPVVKTEIDQEMKGDIEVPLKDDETVISNDNLTKCLYVFQRKVNSALSSNNCVIVNNFCVKYPDLLEDTVIFKTVAAAMNSKFAEFIKKFHQNLSPKTKQIFLTTAIFCGGQVFQCIPLMIGQTLENQLVEQSQLYFGSSPSKWFLKNLQNLQKSTYLILTSFQDDSSKFDGKITETQFGQVIRVSNILLLQTRDEVIRTFHLVNRLPAHPKLQELFYQLVKFQKSKLTIHRLFDICDGCMTTGICEQLTDTEMKSIKCSFENLITTLHDLEKVRQDQIEAVKVTELQKEIQKLQDEQERLTKEKIASKFKCKRSYAEYIADFCHSSQTGNFKNSQCTLKKLQKDDKVSKYLDAGKLQLNDEQKAIAHYLTIQFTQHKKSICLQYGAGMGKSRIAAATAMMILQLNCINKDQQIHFLYPTKHLKDRDQLLYEDLWLNNFQNKVHYHDELGFEKGDKDIIFVDESDKYLFDQTNEFSKFVSKNRVISFTATALTTLLEKEILEKMNFVVITGEDNSTLLKDILGDGGLPSIGQRDGGLQMTDTIEDMIEPSKRPTLIFCDDDQAQKIKDKFKNVWSNEELYEVVNKGSVENSAGGEYIVMVATDEEFMRSVDYRAPEHGINLIIGKSFSGERDATQGLNRVGRMKDSCDRYILKGIDLVDSRAQKRLQIKLVGQIEKVEEANRQNKREQKQQRKASNGVQEKVISNNVENKFDNLENGYEKKELN